jgi:lipopolysaccharide/colanic/teichoic acid biosynthesis glycosyltransferase
MADHRAESMIGSKDRSQSETSSIRNGSTRQSWRNRTFDVTLMTVLALLTAPIMATIAVLILVTSGRPIIYRGVRLGRNKRPFTMYKFRTLLPDAHKKLGARLFSNESDLITPLGKFLRPTRLDELPQFFNVLKGDMQIIGPRPVRPEVYEEVCRNIPGYEMRFSVRPGLIGPSQLFTPHSCQKIIRTIIDNQTIRQHWNTRRKLNILCVAAIAVVRTAVHRAVGAVHAWMARAGVIEGSERREWDRVRPKKARAHMERPSTPGAFEFVGTIVDIDSTAFRVRREQPLKHPQRELARLEIEARDGPFAPEVTRRAFVECKPYRHSQEDGEHHYVWRYKPFSPLSHFVIHKYFLRESLA